MNHPLHVQRLRAVGVLTLALTLVLTMASAVLPGAAHADDAFTIDPDVNVLTLAEGATFEETLTVTVAEGAGIAAADIYFLMDTTGSMSGPIGSLRASASAVMNGLVADFPEVDLAFGAGDFKDFQSPTQFDPYSFRHQVSLTGDVAAVQAGIDQWIANGGDDLPEGHFYAFDQIAENRAPSNDGSSAGTIGWRPDAKRILVVFGDAPAHDPVCSAITSQVNGHAVPYDITEASATAKLVSAGITFIGISTTTGVANGMDGQASNFDYTSACGTSGIVGPGQASRIAAATGGVHLINVATADIAAAVEEQVGALVETIANLSLVPTGDTAQFVTSVTPPGGYGPLELDEEQTLTFDVVFEGNVPATDVDQVFTGTLDVVADGVVVAQKQVTITVPGVSVAECVDLLAGQHILVGEVCVENDGEKLSVTYTTIDGWYLTETHLAVSADMPGGGEWTHRSNRWQNPSGNPAPGRFPYKADHDPAVTSYTYTIHLDDISGGVGPDDVLSIAAHAAVAYGDDWEESAWGAGDRLVKRGNWATYFQYTVR